jgi:predicted glycoside hydrolase/deacetylase ChbG (UPF0249 family)
VNADDLGYDAGVTDATFEMMARGRVTSATVMANGAAVDAAARRLRDFPACSFGAHLALTEFAPLTRSPHLAFLCGPDGAFVDRRELLCSWRHVWRPGVPGALYAELSAQVTRLRQLGVPLSHLDSHHHVHAIPALFPIVKRLQAAFGIRRIRPRVNRFDGVHYRAERFTPTKHALHNLALRHVVASATPDGFTALRAFLRQPSLARPGEVLELMVHPGHPLCVAENEQLAGDWLRHLPFPTKLVSYNDLPTP